VAAAAVLAGLFLSSGIAADPAARAGAFDWPQWRGPNHDGISAEKGWLQTWPAEGPRPLWNKSIALGFSAVAVARGNLYTMGNDGAKDIIYCLDAATGNEKWNFSYPCDNARDWPGPRAQPVVDEDRLYTCSWQGDIYCLKADKAAEADKQVVWEFHAKDLKMPAPNVWGFAGSALIQGKTAIFNVGSSGLALDKMTGEVVWKSNPKPSGQAAPVPFKLEGRECLAFFGGDKRIVCATAADGHEFWSAPWPTGCDVCAADPIVVGKEIFVASGYGTGCALFEIGKDKPLWRNKQVRAHFSSPILYEGFLYGIDGNTGEKNTLKCIDPKTSEMKWSKETGGMASMMLADGKLIIMVDGGTLVLAEASPAAYKELARAKVTAGLCWTMPVLSNGRIYCRNYLKDKKTSELVCVDVSGK
jgi:outer membrane protein assembly factor BamB